MAKPSKIALDIAKTEKQIEKLHFKIKALRQRCKHRPIFIREKYEGNTGNYDPHSDSYWVMRECTNCGMRWHIDSEEPGYRSVIPFNDRRRNADGYDVHIKSLGK